MAWYLTFMIILALAGFVAGLVTFRLKQRWCPTCGAVLTCPDTTYHGNDRSPHVAQRLDQPDGRI